ncbi:hypothetical protein HK101_002701 [Irineochytrium annulatum]|nr:hypothetical protein HK101_002701 [Irineochytrium annulatum]
MILEWLYSGSITNTVIAADDFKIAANAKYLACEVLFEKAVDELAARCDQLNFQTLTKDVPSSTVLDIATDVIKRATHEYERRVTMLADIGDAVDDESKLHHWCQMIADSITDIHDPFIK